MDKPNKFCTDVLTTEGPTIYPEGLG